jgi:DHA1 family bicyclomycin/chloramphenicol resistance-like MFS transporter
MQQKPFSLLWIAVLAVLTALGPFSIDMYLSALPTMAKDLSVSTAQIANSLPAYFIGLALGQLVYGPVSDHFGRRKPLFLV